MRKRVDGTVHVTSGIPVSTGYRIFTVCNYILLTMLALICLLPIVNIVAISLSDKGAVAAGAVRLWPVGLTFANYEYVMSSSEFLGSFLTSVERVLIAGILNFVITVITAYPLSKSSSQIRGRTAYVWFFFFATLFNGGLIPNYLVVKETGLLDSIWALTIPGCLPVFNMILLMNYFRGIPRDLEEAAMLDGATHLQTMVYIYVPLAKSCLATITLFSLVSHWNSWFDGMIYISRKAQPLATYLYKCIAQTNLSLMQNTTDAETLKKLMSISDQSTKCANVVLATIPILCVYPFLQRYFTRGIMIGSVKG